MRLGILDQDYQLAMKIPSLVEELCGIRKHRVAVQLLKCVLVVNWACILKERKALAGVMYQALKYRRNSNNRIM